MEVRYAQKTREEIFQAPERFAWNILLRVQQFTQSELLTVREYICLKTMIRYQTSATIEFLREHFRKDIDDCLEVDWNDCIKAGKSNKENEQF